MNLEPGKVWNGCLVAVVAALLACVGCNGVSGNGLANSQTVIITDMLNRQVKIPKDIHRILALHPIPTTLLELLAPERIVSVDTVFARSLKSDDARFTPKQMSSLKSLPVTGVYFKGLDPEQLVKLHPDVVFTMTGDNNIDREQTLTGIPFFAVSKVPTTSYETTIRLIGQIVGRQNRAERMAAFWRHHVAAVQTKAATLPVDRRPAVMYTGQGGDILSIPGKDTVFGSTIETAGGRYVGDALPASHAGTEHNPVGIEQIVQWDPDVIIVASTGARDRIMNDPRWHAITAVHDGRIYVPPQYGGLDGLQAVLGMVWTQSVLLDRDDPNARSAMAGITQDYYNLFYGHPLASTQLDQLAS